MVRHHISAVQRALGEEPPYLVLTNGRIVDVQSGLISEGDIVIKEHRIVSIYDGYQNFNVGDTKIIDVEGRYILPGFIDPHIHIESSLLAPGQFSRVVLLRGTTTVINDPHEIANVLGENGLYELLRAGNSTNLRYLYTVPSCVPSLGYEFETSGATLDISNIKSLLKYPEIVGLGEVMNYAGVIGKDEEVLERIYETYGEEMRKSGQLIVDGHAPGLSGIPLSAYISSGIMSDHECENYDELEEKVKKGMVCMLRWGSFARNMRDLLSSVAERGMNTRRLMICSDDKNTYDLLNHGHLDDALRVGAEVIKEYEDRISIVDLIRMVTLNPAEYIRERYLGRLGIRARADIVVVDDLSDFNVYATFVNGRLVAQEGKLVSDWTDHTYPDSMMNSVRIEHDFRPDDFIINATGDYRHLRVIGIIPDKLRTQELTEKLKVSDGIIYPDIENDILKIVVVERHTGKSDYSVGFVKGFGIQKGAMGSTIGHDSHNLGVIGTNDADIAYAISELKRIQGGVVLVCDGKTLASLQLSLGGLMSISSAEEVVRHKSELLEAYQYLGGMLKDPIVAQSFLQLPVVPDLKITNIGYVKMTTKGPQKISLFVD